MANHRFSRSVMLLLPAVDKKYRDVYAIPSSGGGAGIYSSFAFKAIHSKSALVLDQWFSIPVLGTPCSAHFACLPYLTHLIEIISLVGERAMN